MKTIITTNPDIDAILRWLAERKCAFRIDLDVLEQRRREVSQTGQMSAPIEVQFDDSDDALAFFAWKNLTGGWLNDPEVG